MTQSTTHLYEHRFDELQAQLERVQENPYYRELFKEAGIDASEITSLEEFQDLPFISSLSLAAATRAASDRGPFYTPRVNRTFMTPVEEGLSPLYYTEEDWQRMLDTVSDQFENVGITSNDLVLNTIGYTPFMAGLAFHDAVAETGATVVPVGAGDSDTAAQLAEQLDVTVAIGFPSYIEKIAGKTDLDLDILISAGEPVIYYPERRESLREMVGGAETVVDLYGKAEVGPIAVEDAQEAGMRMPDEFMIAEVIDPESGEVLEPGEIGEMVLTHVNFDAMPMVRFRTGDITKIVEVDRKITLPEGVFGRVDNRLKVKGVKIYPDSFEPVLGRFDGVTGEYTIVVRSPPGSSDEITLYCERGEGESVDIEELKSQLKSQVLVSVKEIEIVDEMPYDEQVIDERSESIT
jgi:phenylacetate-CoA ligase